MNQYMCTKLEDMIMYWNEFLDIAREKGDKEGESKAYYELGKEYDSLEKYEEAVNYFEKSLSIALKIGDKCFEETVYCHLGLAYGSLGKYQKAIWCQEQSLSIAMNIGDKNKEGRAYTNLGLVYDALQSYKAAIEHHQKSLTIAIGLGNKELKSRAYGNLGIAFQGLGEYKEAIKCHEASLSSAVEIGNKDIEAAAQNNLGSTYYSLGEYGESTKHCLESLTIAKGIGNRNREKDALLTLGQNSCMLGKYQEATTYCKRCNAIVTSDKDCEGGVYSCMADVEYRKGNYEEAIRYHEKSLSIAIETCNKEDEGTTYGNLGAAYQSLGNYKEAIKDYEESLRIAREADDKIGKGAAFGKLGAAFQMLCKYKTALIYHERSLEIAIETEDKRSMLTAYRGFGQAYNSLSKYQEAFEYYQRALKIATEIGDRGNEGQAYSGLGDACYLLEEYEEALKHYQKSLDIATEIASERDIGDANGHLGRTYGSLGKHKEAIKQCEKSLRIAIDTCSKWGEATACNSLGSLWKIEAFISKAKHDQDKYHDAIENSERYFKESLRCVEWLYNHSPAQDRFKISIFDNFIQIYRNHVQVLIECQKISEALLVSECGRARALCDQLVVQYGLTDRNYLTPVSLTYADIVALATPNSCILYFAHGIRNGVAIWNLVHQKPLGFFLAVTCKTISRKNVNIVLPFPEVVDTVYNELQVRAQVNCEDRSLDSFKGHGIDENVKDVAYEPLVSSAQNIKPIRKDETESDQDKLESHVRSFAGHERGDALELLYEALVAPVQHNLMEEVIIIPDGPLFKVPFAALRDPKTKLFLSETKRIRLAPSLTTLKILQDSSADHHNKAGALIVGNPAVGMVMYKGSKKLISCLPGAEREANEIGQLLGIAALIGAQATKDVIKCRLEEGVAVVHIAAHGSTDGKIFLAPCAPARRTPIQEDYVLTMKEVQETGCRAQLVVLSCCHSGRGEIRAEGVVGLTRAFLAAGARAVVASLWAIPDEATRLFMLHFYHHLKIGESASASLQQAMREMRKTEKYSAPENWAAFSLIGDDVTINISTK